MIKVLLFYKYVHIDDPVSFKEEHLRKCLNLDIKGRILVAKEGINGSVAGSHEQVNKYKDMLNSDSRFSDIVFKEDDSISIPFKKMIVKIKKEIVNFGKEVNLSLTGKNLSPREFLEIYQRYPEKIGDEIIILDARNDYEAKVGKFKKANTLDISKFRDFPEAVRTLSEKKNKKIIMYCTGGIRCEKASAYLRQEGFSDVSQLKGGILSFGKEFPDTVWEGSCFVFDKRLVSSINSENKPITSCSHCNVPCDLVKNCAKFDCDSFCTICIDCEIRYLGCCSQQCFRLKMENQLQCSNPQARR
ncbi:rhodanese-related sulfurtransferase [Candidatus Pacearchaeota archaeon]|nr:rhodanese-related sulfurtransferase [Candidatus Pacearchaeota archaeon]